MQHNNVHKAQLTRTQQADLFARLYETQTHATQQVHEEGSEADETGSGAHVSSLTPRGQKDFVNRLHTESPRRGEAAGRATSDDGGCDEGDDRKELPPPEEVLLVYYEVYEPVSAA
eukprot:SAG11_NODE_6181_length_1370_cov_1.682927_1_plen_115_part_10